MEARGVHTQRGSHPRNTSGRNKVQGGGCRRGPVSPLAGESAAAGWGHLGHRLLGGSEGRRGREGEAASRAGEDSAHSLHFWLSISVSVKGAAAQGPEGGALKRGHHGHDLWDFSLTSLKWPVWVQRRGWGLHQSLRCCWRVWWNAVVGHGAWAGTENARDKGSSWFHEKGGQKRWARTGIMEVLSHCCGGSIPVIAHTSTTISVHPIFSSFKALLEYPLSILELKFLPPLNSYPPWKWKWKLVSCVRLFATPCTI